MKKIYTLSAILLCLPLLAFPQTEIWHIADTSFHAGSGQAFCLPGNNILVAPFGNFSSIPIFKYDANGNIIFHKDYVIQDATTIQECDRVMDEQGNLFITGFALMSLYTGFVMKIDSDGNQLWILQLIEPDYASYTNSLALDDLGNIYLGGTRFSTYNSHIDLATYKVSANGGLIWSRYFGSASYLYSGNQVAADSEGNVIVSCGISDNSNFQNFNEVLKYDSSGNLLWQNELYSGNRIGPSSLITTQEGNIYLTGGINYFDIYFNPYGYSFAAKISGDGDIIWFNKIIPNDLYTHSGVIGRYVDPAGALYAVGRDTLERLWIIKFASDGNIEWSKNEFPELPDSIGGIGYLKVSGNYMYATGEIGLEHDNADIFVMALDLNGEVQWTNTFELDTESYDQPFSLDLDDYGNVIVAGNSYSYDLSLNYAITVKYDNFLSTGISNIQDDNKNLLIYPNPSTDEFAIRFGDDQEYNIRITDLLGRIVKEFPGVKGKLIFGNEFYAGVYFVTFRSGNEAEMRKIIKE